MKNSLHILFCTALGISSLLHAMEKPEQAQSTLAAAPQKVLSADEKKELHRQFWKISISLRVERRKLITKLIPGHFSPYSERDLSALVQQGLPVNEEFVNDFDEGSHTETHLFSCTLNDDLDNVRFLLEHGAAASIMYAPGDRKSYRYECKQTPLFWAVFNNNISILKLFFEHGATIEPDQKPGLLETAKTLHESICDEVIKLLNEQWEKQEKETASKDVKETAQDAKKTTAVASNEKKSKKK